MRIRTLATIAAGATLMLGGCKDYLVEAPEDFFTPANFPSTEADLKIVLGGIDNWYTGGSNQAYYIRGWPMISEVPSEQTILINNTTDSKYEQDTYTYNSNNEWLWRTWNQMYGAIGQANLLIQAIPNMKVAQDVKDKYTGAAKFHRALNHFNAVRVWGDVPLMKDPITDFAIANNVVRSPMAEVYASIAQDLEDAVKLLPVKWPDSVTPDDGRPTRGAAGTMLADVYANMSGTIINQNKWANAAAAAKAVIDSKAYTLVPNFGDLWLVKNKNGPEHIYSIQFEGLIRNLFTSQSRPSGIGVESGINYWCTTPEFMDSYSDTDLRKKVTFLTQVTVGSTTYNYDTRGSVKGFGDKSPRFPRPLPYYGKFYDNGGQSIALNSGRSNLNWPVYRYAETLLLHAEAENEANGPAAAYASINAVRTRAGLPALAGLTQAQFRDAVRQERSWELAFESKHLFDLKRWGTYTTVIGADPVSKIGWKPTNLWAAIPQHEIDINSGIKQNPGY
ncbi:MAG TPA: RagB/SusD family nutrient uptake outer membrane protein [Gemmatimonadaceae bacterium]